MQHRIRCAGLFIALFLCTLFAGTSLAETSKGIVISIDVTQGFLMLDDEMAYDLSDKFQSDSLQEGDSVELVWEWYNDAPLIVSYRHLP